MVQETMRIPCASPTQHRQKNLGGVISHGIHRACTARSSDADWAAQNAAIFLRILPTLTRASFSQRAGNPDPEDVVA
jgi:hypothetical protein